MAIMMSAEIDENQLRTKQDLRQTDVRTGYHKFAYMSEHAAEGDLQELSARMSGHAAKLASTCRKLRLIKDLYVFISERLEQNATTPAGKPAKASSELLKSHLELLDKRLQMQFVDREYIERRVNIQINVVSVVNLAR